MHCGSCGAPSFVPRCARCANDSAPPSTPKAAAEPPAPLPGTLRASLHEYPRYRAVHSLLQHLWTKAAEGPDYDREEWNALAEGIETLAREGVGEPKPAGSEDPTTVQTGLA